jgi:hypothetical protein
MAVRVRKSTRKGAGLKPLTADELKFATYIAESGYTPVQAARLVFGWKCEARSREAQQARDLARASRVANAVKKIEADLATKAKAESVITDSDKLDVDALRKYAVGKLREIRDSSNTNSRARLHAINALEKLADPTTDLNLIFRWIDLVWRFAKVHCPCCHESYPLWKIHNEKLALWRDAMGLSDFEKPETDLERRLVGLKYADRKGTPHKSQVPFLEAPERHLVAHAPARAGKSSCLAYFGFLAFLLPGIEIWMLAEVFESARSEHEFLMQFLRSAFHPYDDRMFKAYEDKRTNELILESNWGTSLRIRSSKTKGLITGRELELALVVEPAWVPDDVYEELRARMISRLGRILAFGTPKGTGGFIGRMIRVTGRDPVTGKMIRRTPEERLIKNGSPWDTSMFVGYMNPEDNPTYVKSERAAARQELTDSEYASEFLGEMSSAEGAKFPNVTDAHLQNIARTYYQSAVYVLGIDQGPTNFAAVLTAYDGSVIVPVFEYFDGSSDTMSRNLKNLLIEVPKHLRIIGANPSDWIYTITDRAPQLGGTFMELEEGGNPWPTEITMVPKNVARFHQNWRRDTSEFVNNVSARGKLLFDLQYCAQLHAQILSALNVPLPDKDVQSESSKGWKIQDVWRGDHPVDAWFFAMCAIHLGMLVIPQVKPEAMDAWSEARAAQDYLRAKEERKELQGYPIDYTTTDNDLYKNHFGRNPPASYDLDRWGWYNEES